MRTVDGDPTGDQVVLGHHLVQLQLAVRQRAPDLVVEGARAGRILNSRGKAVQHRTRVIKLEVGFSGCRVAEAAVEVLERAREPRAVAGWIAHTRTLQP